jgi:hypothetical protein
MHNSVRRQKFQLLVGLVIRIAIPPEPIASGTSGVKPSTSMLRCAQAESP